jgi:hypothetical protein
MGKFTLSATPNPIIMPNSKDIMLQVATAIHDSKGTNGLAAVGWLANSLAGCLILLPIEYSLVMTLELLGVL